LLMHRDEGSAVPSWLLTELATRTAGANKQTLDRLIPLVYNELHAIAARILRSERPDHTLRPTALINEVYLRLAEKGIADPDRTYFFALAARMMRQVLVDHARSHRAAKRGGDGVRVQLDESTAIAPDCLSDMIVLDLALTRLATTDLRKTQVIELIYFGGLTYAEAAAALGISEATLHRDLVFARSWLRREFSLSDEQS
jgi:RNA polymerase sigma-70 factor, ECF subfamily